MTRVDLPEAEVLWERLREFMGQWGVVSETDDGLVVAWQEAKTELQMSRAELSRYVSDYVAERSRMGLSDGLRAGLPMPLLDSFGEMLGSQDEACIRLVPDGLDLRVAPYQPRPPDATA